jgi:hypothetical protein
MDLCVLAYLGLHTMPYTDGYTVPYDGYGTRTIRTLGIAFMVQCMVQMYAVLTLQKTAITAVIQYQAL